MRDSSTSGNPIHRAKRIVFGAPRDLDDPKIFHQLSLVAFLAWVGLGADGLSSSAYGPDEAYRALGGHSHLALFLILMSTVTIIVISIAYSNLIQHFPGGGGGYLVATKLLGERVGVVSGCALLVDYVLTITVSIASACDQIWSFLPASARPFKLPVAFALILLLIVLNLRGVRESVQILAPVFLAFIGTHVVLIGASIWSHAGRIPEILADASGEFHSSVGSLGFFPVALILLRAYSLGGGTYTGIEAVSNGVATLREPRVRTGKRTMALMAVSLAFTAGGILLAYLLTGTHPVEGKTMNAALATNLFGAWHIGSLPVGAWFVVVILVAEASLLVVAAQTGFIDGPRVLANMAVDSWMPHRFAQLSDRLVTKNGVLVMGLAALAALVYTQGKISTLVVMYSINVFITFSLTELGMAKHFIAERKKEPRWKSQLAIQGTGLILCVSILVITVYEKFTEGGWVTLVITVGVVLLAFAIRSHYRDVSRQLRGLDDLLLTLPGGQHDEVDGREPPARSAPTAVICVASYSGFGIHQILSIESLFPKYFSRLVFVSAAVVDSGVFKGTDEIEALKEQTAGNLARYVDWARHHGRYAESRMAVGTEAVAAVEQVCFDLAREYPASVFFMGRLIFEEEKIWHRWLHNETAHEIERRLLFQGRQAIVLPIRVLEGS